MHAVDGIFALIALMIKSSLTKLNYSFLNKLKFIKILKYLLIMIKFAFDI